MEVGVDARGLCVSHKAGLFCKAGQAGSHNNPVSMQCISLKSPWAREDQGIVIRKQVERLATAGAMALQKA